MSRVSKEWPTTHGRPRMGNDAREKGDREQLPDEEVALTARLHRLGERLDRIRPEAPAEPAHASRPGAASGRRFPGHGPWISALERARGWGSRRGCDRLAH